jgi:predicted MPP superfamily phosphohydrolase
MPVSRIMFYSFVCAILFCAELYWWRKVDRRLRPLRGAPVWRALLATWAGAMALYLVLTCLFPMLVRRASTPIPVAAHAAVFLWHLFVLPVLVLIELLRAAPGCIRKIANRATPVPAPATTTTSPAPTRRQVLGGLAMALPPLATGALVTRAMAQIKAPPRVRRMEISLRQLPAHMDGMTIAHVSDTHVGKFTEPGMLNALADQINQLRADFAVMTGDLIDMSLSDLPSVLDMLNRLDPRQGIVVCEGNHDVYDSRHAFEKRTRAAGLSLLVDESCEINFRGSPVQFLGVKWDEGGDDRIAKSFAAVNAQRNPDAFPILLAHHPHAFDPAAEAGIPLTLSGHTHGGQLMLTDRIGGGPAMFRYWSGLYRKPNASLVVSNGVGVWFPLRINAPAEIIHLTLRSRIA